MLEVALLRLLDQLQGKCCLIHTMPALRAISKVFSFFQNSNLFMEETRSLPKD